MRAGTRGTAFGWRLGLLVGGIAAGLILAEVLVRVLGIAPEVAFIQKGRFRLSRNPKIGYEPAPGLDYGGENLDYYDYRGRSNSLGYRDVEHSVRKPPGVFRIVVLGDSVAAGLKVLRFEDTLPALLERGLKERGHRVEVLSFAISGYNTQQEVETLKDRGLQFEPDLVLLAYCLNDSRLFDGGILDTLLEQERGTRGLSLARLNPLLAHSALYRLVRERLFSQRPPQGPKTGAGEYASLAQNTVETSFAELSTLSRSHHFVVIVAVFPTFEDLRNYPHQEAHEELRKLSQANGFDPFDLLPAFRRCAEESPEALAFDRLHPTERGHACAAAALVDHIEALTASGAGAGPPPR